MADNPTRHCILVQCKFQILLLGQYLAEVYVLIRNMENI
jgi:hypothetical protein